MRTAGQEPPAMLGKLSPVKSLLAVLAALAAAFALGASALPATRAPDPAFAVSDRGDGGEGRGGEESGQRARSEEARAFGECMREHGRDGREECADLKSVPAHRSPAHPQYGQDGPKAGQEPGAHGRERARGAQSGDGQRGRSGQNQPADDDE